VIHRGNKTKTCILISCMACSVKLYSLLLVYNCDICSTCILIDRRYRCTCRIAIKRIPFALGKQWFCVWSLLCRRCCKQSYIFSFIFIIQ